MMIIGITGTIGAGKGTIVDFLIKKYDFVHFSVRDFLTEEVNKRGLELNRDSLTLVGNELRSLHGASYITDQLYQRAIEAGRHGVIESIRAVGEILSLKEQKDFLLFAVDADVEKRFERIKRRGSATDFVDFETFVANEKREMTSTDPNKQNLSKCIAMADCIFYNNDTIEALDREVEKAVEKFIDQNKTE